MHRFICDFLLDIVQNSFEAGAPLVAVSLVEDARRFSCTVADTGRGMDEEMRHRVLDPFGCASLKHPERRVNLGLPFLRETMWRAGGIFRLETKAGVGTTVRFTCDLRHVDTPPVGDVPGTLLLLLSDARARQVSVFRRLSSPKGSGSYRVTREMMLQKFGGLEKSDSLRGARSFLRRQEEKLELLRVQRPLVLTKE